MIRPTRSSSSLRTSCEVGPHLGAVHRRVEDVALLAAGAADEHGADALGVVAWPPCRRPSTPRRRGGRGRSAGRVARPASERRYRRRAPHRRGTRGSWRSPARRPSGTAVRAGSSPVSSSSVRCQPHRLARMGGPSSGPDGDELVVRPRGARGPGAGRGTGRPAHGEDVEAGFDVQLQLGQARPRRPRSPAATGTRTTTSSESPRAIDRIGCSSSFSSMSHTICWAASPRSSAAWDRWSRPRRGAGSMRSLLARSTHSSSRSFISSSRSSSWRTSAARPWSRSTSAE